MIITVVRMGFPDWFISIRPVLETGVRTISPTSTAAIHGEKRKIWILVLTVRERKSA
jgi:hypothetical protein